MRLAWSSSGRQEGARAVLAPGPAHRTRQAGLPVTAIYDGQCEICQAAVSWIRVLDKRGAVRCVAIQDGPLAVVHPSLTVAGCLTGPVLDSSSGIELGGSHLEVLPAPGHSPDHIVLWDPDERVLLAGDAFMGAYFSSPNSDVDSRAWMATLQGLLDLNVSVMVEGHGHVHTLRTGIPPVPGVVQRTDPRRAIERKLEFLSWLQRRIDEAAADGRSVNAAVAACFPWGRRWSWERLAADEIARVSTLGEFSRHELIRSFRRTPEEILPTVFEAQLGASRDAHAV